VFDYRFVHSLAVDLLRRDDVAARAVAPDELFQVQMVQSLLDGNYDGDVTVGELRDKGSFGIGTLQGLDGELVIVDGEFWNVDVEGRTRQATDDQRVPFTVLTDLRPEVTVDLPGPLARAEVERAILDALADPDGIYAVRVDGRFTEVGFRSVAHQDPPYRPFAEVLETDERIFERSDLDAVMVGFYFPDRAAGVNLPGWHFHMIATDRTTGGHVYDFTLEAATVQAGRIERVHLELPERGMADVLGLDEAERTAQLTLVRDGAGTAAQVAERLGIDVAAARQRLDRLVQRGFVDVEDAPGRDADLDDPTYRPHLRRTKTSRLPAALDGL
jgi:acetolactate decarboxylase